jgi:hypothetical protein
VIEKERSEDDFSSTSPSLSLLPKEEDFGTLLLHET